MYVLKTALSNNLRVNETREAAMTIPPSSVNSEGRTGDEKKRKGKNVIGKRAPDSQILGNCEEDKVYR
jgi:hypothetical protein